VKKRKISIKQLWWQKRWSYKGRIASIRLQLKALLKNKAVMDMEKQSLINAVEAMELLMEYEERFRGDSLESFTTGKGGSK